MRMARLHLYVLALLALCGGAFARPTEEGAQANRAASPDSSLANCPHTPQGDVTPEQAQGVWYILEGIYLPITTEMAESSVIPPCMLYNFTFEGTRLLLSSRVGNGEDNQNNWTFHQAPNGLWVAEGSNSTISLSSTADGKLLLICSLDSRDVPSFVLSRSPRLDEAAVTALRSPAYAIAPAMRPDLQSCEALTAAAAPAPAADPIPA